ncbi:MAG: DNA (cytosine-5-)-methyltransferase [Candidatus Raymondbacteria bacterium RifOxyA12_full_50_37]|uniref:Cytosine-specific methyltransferase n=1 Tax=Candidatus Raymondbacteria bacterium RIFOXYD12_FULL_49_13 TaxID=1817890 RepID=A0A1F7F988_UNCRA|nr:MAG: DNA (cytosine-5-)-methyltransferase [Candidatus Raymondbacteria bacterium RifOxyA12_full_50_37]OGJ87907.1 MAG: DNA (cytosine-5-)-methyltransferase [Candidatus Raymondbacteria bacterium RIFOXYA2_FULL_49_16]OGK03239.1 MAG: DNA (cytosine-5-)-methyltransferase [Candidatus Raymondbacteria bacterium RIFOXYD12_FULL_49_13]OGK07601.1 MAG: DNA (cytosine-5-)-methyltransferase [Candidatus Raymondbacteria bacterium RifOxyC12_full_50_8]OGP41614.1 MAG: DNA (cytosine-5-)-methyltransferase [Candidatus R
METLRCIEICAGAGGQALGLERAGFHHEVLVEIDKHACETLRINRPRWNIFEGDVHDFSAKKYSGIDLLSGGVPCPPFSVAGKQLGKFDSRDLFPEAIRLVSECMPKTVMLENVKGLLSPSFMKYRKHILKKLFEMGYSSEICAVNACDFGVSQNRTRVIIIAIRKDIKKSFCWPAISPASLPTVGELLYDLMKQNGWHGALEWKKKAKGIAPTLVGGSTKHGGPDLGPTRSRKAWLQLGVDGTSLADEAPVRNFIGNPKLTPRMAARIQGFPDDWQFSGRKTAAYRQIGNAFPPPVAESISLEISLCIKKPALFKKVA